MLKELHQFCPVRSNIETEVYTGSAACRRCQYFNGLIKQEKVISCLIPTTRP